MRQKCHRCGKAEKACICQWIQSIDTKTELIVLQHPSEVDKPIGTARILELSLSRCHRFVGEDFSQHEELNRLLSDDGIAWYTLYPGEKATSVSSIATESERQGFILLDGTWKKAFKMWQLSTNLHGLPTCVLDAIPEGRYQIRKSSKSGGVSTVEAGYHALKALEPENGALDHLLVPFEKMIAFQIAQMPDGVFERNYRND